MNVRIKHRIMRLTVVIVCAFQVAASAQEPIKLLVRADDMGATYDKTLGIIKAYKDGIVTSASLMPNSAFFDESVQLCKDNPGLAVGLHITLLGSKERPVLSPEKIPTIVTDEGFFHEKAEQLLADGADPLEIEREIRAQIGQARASGLDFVYMDHHRGVPEVVKEVIYKLCREQQLIYGQVWEGSVYGYIRLGILPENWPYQKMPDGQIVYYAAPAFTQEQKEAYWEKLENLEPGKWLAVEHPGLFDPERAGVTELMCHPRTLEIIRNRNIQLVSYRDLWEEVYGKEKRTK